MPQFSWIITGVSLHCNISKEIQTRKKRYTKPMRWTSSHLYAICKCTVDPRKPRSSLLNSQMFLSFPWTHKGSLGAHEHDMCKHQPTASGKEWLLKRRPNDNTKGFSTTFQQCKSGLCKKLAATKVAQLLNASNTFAGDTKQSQW